MGRESGSVRALFFIVVALFLGSVSLVVLYRLINSYEEAIDEAKKPEDTVMVIVAARDLYQGVTINDEDLYGVRMPPRFLPDGVFLSPEHVIGRIPRERILHNEFVRADRLADPEAGKGLNAIVPRGMRAISIELKDGAALGGFLNPGNYVDLLVTITPEDDSEDVMTRTETLLQAVFVLGVNSRMEKESFDSNKVVERGKQKPSVTLLVMADQAEQVAHADNLGEIRLSLRNAQDILPSEALPGVDMNALLGRMKAPTAVRAAPAPKRASKPKGPPKNCVPFEKITGGEKVVVMIDAVTGAPCK